MQSEIKIRCCRNCPIKYIRGYCYTCEKLFCTKCRFSHVRHSVVEIKDYCEEKKISIYELAVQLEEKRKRRIEIANMLKEGPMEYCVALFIAGREEFFKKKACINCTVDKFCACDGADVLFDVDGVMRKRLINVGQGVKMTEPIKVEKGLLTGKDIYASISHEGILAICANEGEDYDCTLQLTDLNNYRQVNISIYDSRDAYEGFYDDMILLQVSEHLWEAKVEDVFNNPYIETFRKIRGVKKIEGKTDVSLLHATRMLYYTKWTQGDNRLYCFNVDYKGRWKNGSKAIVSIASLTGVNCGVEYKCYYNGESYKVNEGKEKFGSPLAIFPSASNPSNFKDAVFKYGHDLVKCRNKLNSDELIKFEGNYSVVRIYKDIFLAYDKKTESWVLLRIIVP